MTKKLDLHIEDLEERIAPNLLLPSGQNIFSGADNAAPGNLHPAIVHNQGGAPGPWHAHFNTDQIECTEC